MAIEQFLLLCGIIAGPLFIIVFLVEGALRANYDVLREPVSALSLGSRGWIQRTNFLVQSILMFLFAFGIRTALIAYGDSLLGPLLAVIYSIALIGAGIFNTDPTRTTGTSYAKPKHTFHGILHIFFSTFIFVTICITQFVFAHMFAIFGSFGWSLYSLISGALYGIGTVLFWYGLSHDGRLKSIAGLLQRITIIIGLVWLTLFALHFFLM